MYVSKQVLTVPSAKLFDQPRWDSCGSGGCGGPYSKGVRGYWAVFVMMKRVLKELVEPTPGEKTSIRKGEEGSMFLLMYPAEILERVDRTYRMICRT